MAFIKRLLLFIALFQIAFSPALARPQTQNEKITADLQQHLEPMGYKIQVSEDQKKMLVYDNNGNVFTEIPFSEQDTLKKFSPRTLNRLMLEEMIKIKNANAAGWSGAVRNLPSESAMFFVAMGAVMAGQLILNYAQNPIAMEQHIEHSMSPLGVFGFFTFMYTQGVTSNVLAMYLKNPKFHTFIPYMGMIVGGFTQMYLSGIASDPNVKACAKIMMNMPISDKEKEIGVDETACEKAYEHLVINKKLWELAPQLASMVISGFIAAAAEKALVTKAVSRATLRLVGFDIALWLTPGTMQVKGIRLLLVKGLRITAFVALDVWLNRHIVNAWKNIFDGKEFNTINQELLNTLNPLMAGVTGSGKDAQEKLKHFHKRMGDWRMMNLSEVYEAHHSWGEAIRQLTQMHNASEKFYGDFVSEIRNSRFDESNFKALEHIYVFAGVPGKDISKDKNDSFYLRPAYMESTQAETITDAVGKLKAHLNGPYLNHILPQEKRALESLIQKLSSSDRLVMGQGLVEFNQEYSKLVQDMYSSYHYREWMLSLKQDLGNPQGFMEPGRGFMYVYQNAPMNRELSEGLNYYRNVAQIPTPLLTDFFVMQMICGPDVEKNEQTVRSSVGFKSVFMPPRISKEGHEFTICDRSMSPLSLNMPHKYPLMTYDGQMIKEVGVIPYLLKNARTQAIGNKDKNTFKDWWRNNTEKQMMDAFDNFQEKYDKIVTRMTELIQSKGKRLLNSGEIDNGTLQAIRQELYTYMYILESLKSGANSVQFGFENVTQKRMSPEAQAVINLYEGIVKQLDRIKVVKVEGKNRIASDLENYEIEESLEQLQTGLQEYAALLGVGEDETKKVARLNKDQHEVAVLILEKIQAIGMETMMYGTMANAVTWSKIRDIKRINIEQQAFQNEIQKKVNSLLGSKWGSSN